MRTLRLAAMLLALLGATASAADPPSPRERLFADLGAESASVRDTAQRKLEGVAGLTEDEVRRALASASPRTRPALYRVAAVRGMKGLTGDIAEGLSSGDPLTWDGAARALVSLGDDAVAAGLAKLGTAKSPEIDVVRRRLRALQMQRAVEHGVVSRWRFKGGSYEGRYKELEKLGWPVQPVLLAMLLDVPLADHHLVLPEGLGPVELEEAKFAEILSIANSDRRGYRTFDPLPPQIEPELLFDLAAQAMKDVADMSLLGDILTSVSVELEEYDKLAGQRLRRFEEQYFETIDVVLAARKRPERLQNRAAVIEEQVDRFRQWLSSDRSAPGEHPDEEQVMSSKIQDLASLLHQLGKFDEAAELFKEAIAIGKELTDMEPAIPGYNRACALARGGHADEAFEQLVRSLDRDVSAGFEDLTREWVTEDGDLRSLHDDPRWDALIEKRFGK